MNCLRSCVLILRLLNLLIDMSKTVKTILEIVKLVVTAILGYYGGNAIM